MFEDNVIGEDLDNDGILSDDSLFDEGKTTSLLDEEDDDIDFDSFDDSTPDW